MSPWHTTQLLHRAATALRGNAADLRRFTWAPDGRSFDAPFVDALANTLDDIATIPADERQAPLAALDGEAMRDLRHFLADYAPGGERRGPADATPSADQIADVRAVLGLIEAAVERA